MVLLESEKIWCNSVCTARFGVIVYVQLIRFLKNNISLLYALTQPLDKTSLIGRSSFSQKNGNFV